MLQALALGWPAVKRAKTDGNPPTVEKHVHGMWLDVVGLWNEGVGDRRSLQTAVETCRLLV